MINIAICITCKKLLLDAGNMILIRYYYETAITWALYEPTDGPARQPTDNPPIWDGLWDVNPRVHQLTVRVYWTPGPPIWTGVGSDPYVEPKRQSGTVPNPHRRVGQFFPQVRGSRLQAVKHHRRNHSRQSCSKSLCSSQSPHTGRR